MRNFRELDVWNDSIAFVKLAYLHISDFPKEEKFGFKSQIARAVVSIPSNIAEGCSRNSQREFSRFWQIALESSYELETQLHISKEIGILSEEKYTLLVIELNRIQKRMNSLRKYAD
ncbi:four helix bundle protein [Sungkyunkwania multivorans]|uniref:Four helix bundle protein n=1 Tax=Sungkyunkwania multivorans TaxID=1173618 RepID=A0ABW3D2B6_9FLAO